MDNLVSLVFLMLATGLLSFCSYPILVFLLENIETWKINERSTRPVKNIFPILFDIDIDIGPIGVQSIHCHVGLIGIYKRQAYDNLWGRVCVCYELANRIKISENMIQNDDKSLLWKNR